MFCEKCGGSIKEGDNFCQSCGFRKEGGIDLRARKFCSSAWFRFLKVIYLVVYVVAFLATIAISIEGMPERMVDNDLSAIKCDNGKTYSLEKNNLNIYYSDTLSDYVDKNARILCRYDTVDYYKYSGQTIDKNYVFYPVYIEPHFFPWFAWSMGAVLSVWILLKLIKLGVLYIALGESPKWSEEFFKKLM